MRKNFFFLLILFAAFVAACGAEKKNSERQYRNLFAEAGENKNGKLAYICDINNNDVRNEGMSYGMMMALLHCSGEFNIY